MNKKLYTILAKTGIYSIFIAFTVMTIYPLFWLAYSSLKTNFEIQKNAFTLPEILQFSNYGFAWKFGQMNTAFTNSTIFFTFTILLVIMSGMMASYAFAKMPFHRTSKFIYGLIGFGILISTHSVIIPLFLLLNKLGLTNTRTGVVLTYTAVSLPLAIFIGTEYIRGLPDSIMESAFIDGASNFRMFLSIILPITAPVMVTIGIVTGLAAWNEFLLGFIITGPTTRGLPPTIVAFANPRTPKFHLQFAALMISVIPNCVAILCF